MSAWGWTAAPNPRVVLSDSEAAAIHMFGLRYTAHAARLTSPKFNSFLPSWWKHSKRGRWGAFTDHEPFWSPTWHIRRVLTRLHTSNMVPGTFGIMAVFVNETCRLRIGITADVSEDYDHGLQTFKTILKTSVLCERFFDAAKGIRTIRRGSMNARDLAERIQAQPTHAHLSNLARHLLGGSSVTLSRRNHLRGSMAFHSVWYEFPASLKPDAILSTVDACRKIVYWARGPRHSTQEHLVQSALDPRCKLPAFLQSIGLAETALDHFRAPLPKYGVEQSQAAIDFHHTMRNIARQHPLWLLLHNVALSRLWDMHEVNIEMISNEKIRNGEYGWLPTGPALNFSSAQSSIYVASTPSGEWLAKPLWHDTSSTRYPSCEPGSHELARRDSAILMVAGEASHAPTVQAMPSKPAISFSTDLGLDEDGSIGWKLVPKRLLAMKQHSVDDWAVATSTSKTCGSQEGFTSVMRRSTDWSIASFAIGVEREATDKKSILQ